MIYYTININYGNERVYVCDKYVCLNNIYNIIYSNCNEDIPPRLYQSMLQHFLKRFEAPGW